MAASLTRAAPVRFLIGITLVWTMARGVAVVGWAPSMPLSPALSPARHADRALPESAMMPAHADHSPLPVGAAPFIPIRLRAASTSPIRIVTAIGTWRSASMMLESSADDPPPDTNLLIASAEEGGGYRRDGGVIAAASLLASVASSRRWSGSAWSFLRGGGRASALSPGGQIGGGQAGARLLYRLDGAHRLAAAGRISAAIGGARQTEAAFGLDWKPIATLPIHLMADRRLAIDRGGRNAWTFGAAGGVDDVRIAPGWRLDGYGEAGVVGARRRDLYADGAARIARSIRIGTTASLALGGGAWGAAQPGATRIDIGPSVTVRLPVAHHAVAVALDWRERVAGHAKPGSGLALTIATDF